MPIAPGQTIGQYHIQEKLGEGGMGAVFKAQQSGVNRTVVVKVLTANFKDNPQMLERFKREVDIIAQLEHPHILPVYDFGEAEGNPYIVMRFMRGGSLLDALQSQRFNREDTLRILEQIADALGYAHDRHIIHRDLKPANILLDERGNAYLADFGLARTLEGSSELTKTGSILGTPAYMSPEQGRGEKLDQRSDIYALGIIAFEALAGRPPFEAETSWKLISKHLTEMPPPITSVRPDLPYAVEEVINQALAKDRADRPARASDFIKSLRAALAQTENGATAGLGQSQSSRAGLTQPPVSFRTGAPATASVAPAATSASRVASVASATPRAQSTTSLAPTAAIAIPVVLALGLGVLVILGLALGGLYLFRDRIFPPQITTYPIGTAPRALAFDGQDIWVASGVGQFVARVRAVGCETQPDSCGQTSTTYPADSLVTGLAFDGANIWVANGISLSLSKLDKTSGQVIGTTPLAYVPSNLIFGGGYLWVSSSKAGHIVKVSPDGTTANDFSVGGGPLAMLYDTNAGKLWVATEDSKQLLAINPDSGEVLQTIALGGSIEVNALASDGKNIWVTQQDKNELVEVDATGSIVRHVTVGSGPVAVILGGDSLWVANRGSGNVSRVDPANGSVLATLTVSPKPYALTYTSCGSSCGYLWIIDVENDVLQRARVK